MSSLTGADDPRTMPELAPTLSARDRATLRRLAGDETLAEWASHQQGPYRVKDTRLLARMQGRAHAYRQARTMARVCPSAYLPAVVR